MQPTNHREAASRRLSSLGRRYFNFIEFDDNEDLMLEIRKHPVGLAGIYITGVTITLGIVMVMAMLTYFVRSNTSSYGAFIPLVALGGGLIAFAAIIMTAIGAYLYQSNVIFVTSEKIAQVVYKNIVSRKISQLSIGDVQDVTVTQKGILSRLFHYGTLVIETAGEQQNYTFSFVPHPYESAKIIVGTHEENLKKYGN